ncbi:MAG: DNA methylase, partial [Lysobacterales bacterium]
MQIEMWPIDRLIFYARNPRKNDHAVDNIAAGIREFGFRVPVIAKSDGTVVDGHLRLKAAKKLGLAEVPVVLADDLTDTQIKAFRISVNKMADLADWDMELLALEFADLSALDFDLSLTGFGEDELAALLADKTAGLTDPDDVPPLPEAPVTVTGDTWLLGRHRLRCGDSTNADDVAALLAGVEPHLMVTDPPYGVNYDASWRAAPGSAGPNSEGSKKNHGGAAGKVSNDNRSDWREAWALFPGDVAYVWCAPGPLNVTVHDSLAASGIAPRMQIIWAKSRLVIGRGHYHMKHETCWYAVRKGKTG